MAARHTCTCTYIHVHVHVQYMYMLRVHVCWRRVIEQPVERKELHMYLFITDRERQSLGNEGERRVLGGGEVSE